MDFEILKSSIQSDISELNSEINDLIVARDKIEKRFEYFKSIYPYINSVCVRYGFEIGDINLIGDGIYLSIESIFGNHESFNLLRHDLSFFKDGIVIDFDDIFIPCD